MTNRNGRIRPTQEFTLGGWEKKINKQRKGKEKRGGRERRIERFSGLNRALMRVLSDSEITISLETISSFSSF